MSVTTPGRPRDAEIDQAVLDTTLHHLATHGYAALSLAAIAADAGTTRPAIYRRWPNKDALVVDAVAALAAVEPPPRTGAPFTDLVTELEHFRHCICEAAALPLAGLMLTDSVEPAIRARYHELIVAPRRARIRAILDEAITQGELPEDSDLLVAGSFFTGSWYSFALVGTEPPPDWAARVVRLVWRACGGTPPTGV